MKVLILDIADWLELDCGNGSGYGDSWYCSSVQIEELRQLPLRNGSGNGHGDGYGNGSGRGDGYGDGYGAVDGVFGHGGGFCGHGGGYWEGAEEEEEE